MVVALSHSALAPAPTTSLVPSQINWRWSLLRTTRCLSVPVCIGPLVQYGSGPRCHWVDLPSEWAKLLGSSRADCLPRHTLLELEFTLQISSVTTIRARTNFYWMTGLDGNLLKESRETRPWTFGATRQSGERPLKSPRTNGKIRGPPSVPAQASSGEDKREDALPQEMANIHICVATSFDTNHDQVTPTPLRATHRTSSSYHTEPLQRLRR